MTPYDHQIHEAINLLAQAITHLSAGRRVKTIELVDRVAVILVVALQEGMET